MKKIIPYLVFINCNNENQDDKNPTSSTSDTNQNPVIGNQDKRKNNPNKNDIRNQEILDRINKIHISASTPERDFTEEEWNEIQKLKIEYQENNQEQIIEKILPSTELGFNEEKIKSIEKEAQRRKIFVGIDNLIKGMPINIFFNLYPLPVEKFTNENEEIIIIQEIEENIYSFISTIENFKKLYEKEISLLEFYQEAKFFDKDGNVCSFIEKDFSKTETDQGFYRIKIYSNLINDEEYSKYLKKYIEQNKDKKFIISIPNIIDQNGNINFFESFKECQNCYWENLKIEKYKSLFKNVDEIYNPGWCSSIEILFKSIFNIKKTDILHFKTDFNEIPNQKIEKGKIFTVEDFFKNLDLKETEKIKLKFYSFLKKDIEESKIYEKYKDYFEISYE